MEPGGERYEPTWESLRSYRVPEWFKDAKLGIFVHWGVYAVPAYDNEWYPRNMYRRDTDVYEHHRRTWGDQGRFGYKDFIPRFRAERWDPRAWIDLFEEAGARYVVPVAEHHDGFPMYATPLTEWNAARMGPCRDVVAELRDAVRERGLRFGVSSHRAYNWRYYAHDGAFDTSDAAHAGLYGPPHPAAAPAGDAWLADWHARTRELIDRFEPDLLWFDFGWHETEFAPFRPQVTAYYYNRALEWERPVVLNYKDKFPEGTAVYDVERGKLDDIRADYWQTDTSVSSKSWGYIENDRFKTATTLVHDLVDIVSKNGNLLLNVGPRADGTIPDEASDLLRSVGAWLNVNGEAIHGTRHWLRFGEGETKVGAGHHTESQNEPLGASDIRFTARAGALYAICPQWPRDGVTIRSLGSDSSVPAERIEDVRMLGADDPLRWTQDASGLRIAAPGRKPCEHAYVFRIRLKGG